MQDLSWYDVILVNSSGGKDSQAQLDYVVELADRENVRSRMVVVHCDLGRVEWPGTRALAQRQAEHYGLRFEVVARDRDLLHQIEHERKKFPDAARRYCTSDQKTSQVARLVTRLVKELRAGCYVHVDGQREREWRHVMYRKVRILNCLGMRAQESPARAKKDPFGPDPTHWSKPPSKRTGAAGVPHGLRHVDRWLPIHTWTEDQVWERISQSGVEHHPAYDLGMPRLSCSFCILASKSALIRAAQLRPGLAAEYVRIETEIGHTFKKDLSMADIVAAAAREPAPVAIDSWVA
jgi:3'-phosphoadenosine 5'-phosphosulfate sulfotransferase (PAPS reductase)/FAD synthetase